MQAQSFSSNPTISLDQIEEAVFTTTQSFKDRIETISLTPVTTEADVLAVKAAVDQLTSDMQSFSNSLILEGPLSGILLNGPVLGHAVTISEGPRPAAA